MKIAIIGLGIVGTGMTNLFKDRFEVVGYDPLSQPDPIKVMGADLAIICVPTNMKEDGSADTSIVEDVVTWIDAPLILIKSTIPPTTTDRLVKKYGKKICFSPEYIGESKYFTPFWKYPDPTDAKSHTFVVIGGNQASEIANYFMKVMSVDTVYHLCSSTEAELIKYLENSFFSTKVTFCNEFYNICKAFNVDWKGVREGWLLDSRVNKNHTLVFEDERGFGGKCFPKDTNAIVKASEDAGYTPTLLKAVLEANKRMRNV